MKVTVVTSTVGRESLRRCIDSVEQQTHKDIQHLIMVDGIENFGKSLNIMDTVEKSNHAIFIPNAVGKDRWNGHRIYAAGTFLAEGEYIMFLDDDNFLEPNHVESCLEKVKDKGWTYSLRNIVDKNGNFITRDDCESLGPDYPTVLGEADRLVDVNCYFLHTRLAVYVAPVWYRKAREPNVMEVDRALVKELSKITPAEGTGKYTVNYAVDGNQHSVNSGFFVTGNESMEKRYPNGFPWRK